MHESKLQVSSWIPKQQTIRVEDVISVDVVLQNGYHGDHAYLRNYEVAPETKNYLQANKGILV
jgi:methionine aminopeptidase